MNTIILASHGELSQGMKQTAAMIIGSDEHIHAFSAFRDEDEPISEQVKRILEKQTSTAAIYILTDILGGSVNNDLLALVQQYPNAHLLTGMNLPLVIGIATQNGPIQSERLAQIIEESRQALIDCQQLLVNQQQCGGDDL
jgi:fructoselysine and glucoselysine-specific PTS system IIA component